MNKSIELNKQLKQEIDNIQNKYSLKELLRGYGKLHITGSYLYDLMAWRDFDLVLETPQLNEECVYSLVQDIKIKIKPNEIKIFNNLNRQNKNRPEGFWIGIYLEEWKIDLWVMDKINARKETIKTKRLIRMLEKVDKGSLISLKSELSKDPNYHNKFSSVDLYHAFIEGVKNVEQFHTWLQKNSRK